LGEVRGYEGRGWGGGDMEKGKIVKIKNRKN
jgi:hypothetical protein